MPTDCSGKILDDIMGKLRVQMWCGTQDTGHLETVRDFHQAMPQINLALDQGGLAVFDEIDADLHMDIVDELMHWFRSRERNPLGAQLLLTSHNVGLLDNREKEELYIVEKSRCGATRVHGARDVEGLRRDARLYSKYRAGVIGGVPNIG